MKRRAKLKRPNILLGLIALALAGGAVAVLLLLALLPLKKPAHYQLMEEAHFGGIDPHFVVSVVDHRVLESGQVGFLLDRRFPDGSLTSAGGEALEYHLFRVRLSNSAASMDIDPSRLIANVVVGGDRRLAPVWSAPAEPGDEPLGTRGPTTELDSVPASSTDLPLAAGQSREQWMLFAVPRSTPEPLLWISQSSWLTRLLPGGELHALHPKLVLPFESSSVPVADR